MGQEHLKDAAAIYLSDVSSHGIVESIRQVFCLPFFATTDRSG
jgi:hypothetical protein